MSDTVFVALDGSVPAKNAAHIAIQIAQAEHKGVAGLYIVDETLVLDSYANYQEELGRNDKPTSRDELITWFRSIGNTLLNQLEKECHLENIPVSTEILFGGVPDLILQKTQQAFLASLGRLGKSHNSDPAHLGRNFRLIAHHAQAPLIVGGDQARSIRHLFLVYDGSAQADIACDWATRLQQKFSADVMVSLIGQNDSNSSMHATRKRLNEHGLADYDLGDYRSASIEEILDSVGRSQADLILMGGYRHPQLVEWLVGSPVDQILRQNQLPAVIT